MDHIVYVDFKAGELDALINGSKTLIIRGAMGRKVPYGRVNIDDNLYFIRNNGEGVIKAKAKVVDVFNSEKLTKEQSEQIVEKNKNRLLISQAMIKRFAGKRYLVLVEVSEVRKVTPFKIDKSEYGNMDDWLPVGDIRKITIN